MPIAALRRFFALALLLAATPSTAAEDAGEAAGEPPGPSLVPIPIVYYTPETRMAFGGAATWLFRPADAAAEDRPSRVAPLLIYTSRSQLLLGLFGEFYLDGGRSLLSAGLRWRDFPDSFYGIGNDNAEDADEDYIDEGAALGVEYQRRLGTSLWLGGGVEYATSSIQGTGPGERLHDGGVAGSEGGRLVGLGLVAAWDSRDNVNFPRRGAWHSLRAATYPGALGSDFDHDLTSADLRWYLPLGAEPVLGLRVLGRHGRRTVPFQVLPALGGDTLLRGYYAGRFRDRSLLALQAEYRGPLFGRLGWVGFAAAGQVGDGLDALAADRFHGAAGFGLRYLLLAREGLHLRMDFGFGEDSSGFYFGLGEVF